MSEIPTELRYAKSHEWARLEEDGTVTIGISDHAQTALGDVVYVDLPEVGDIFEASDPFGSVESVKAVSEVFCPLSGEVIEVNSKLEQTPELVNQSPHQKAWMIRLRVSNPDELDELLSAEEYEEYLQEQAGT